VRQAIYACSAPVVAGHVSWLTVNHHGSSTKSVPALCSLRYVPTAVLSRQTAGLRGKSLIMNLPGKPKSIRETIDEVWRQTAGMLGRLVTLCFLLFLLPFCW
jgi:hypothetical protein